jgi:predicted nucleotidyltransferase
MKGIEMDSQKRQNFVRLAEARTQRAMKAIRVIGNLSNRGSYNYTENDVREIVQALQNELTALKTRFSLHESGSAPEFKLSQ